MRAMPPLPDPSRGVRVIRPPPRRRPVARALLLGCAAALAACEPTPSEAEEAEETAPLVDDDFDGWPIPQDCDDTLPGINPGAAEACNGSDDDCDGLTDEHPIDGQLAWLDMDRDGWGDDPTRDTWCGDRETDSRPWVTTGGDCDDGDIRVHPGAYELCGNPGDEDCDGGDNDFDAVGCTPWYLDLDGDGVGTEESACLCEADASWRATAPGDCDDTDATVTAGCAMTGARDLNDADLVIVGADIVDRAGADVAPGGDPGGDGWPDLLLAGDDGRRDPVWWRVAGPFGATADLGAATATYTDSRFLTVWGQWVAGGQDLDGDGVDDVVLAAYGEATSSGARMQGVAWVVSGDVGGAVDLAWADATVSMDRTSASSGLEIAVSPDMDGDGIGDLVLGDTDGETVSVFAGPLVGELVQADAAFTIEGEDIGLGNSLAAVGDLDGDGLGDIVVGAPLASGSAGEAWIVRGGSSGAVGREGTLAVVTGETGSHFLGMAAAGPGDLDGDGAPDLLVVGDPDDAWTSDTGITWLLPGPFAGTVSVADATARIEGGTSGDGAYEVTAPGDMDGDGFADIAIGAPGVRWPADGAGAAFVFFGPLSGALVANEADLRLYGSSASEEAGVALAPAGDIDRDGLPDLLVGAPGADLGEPDSGGAYVVRGGAR